MITSAKAPIPVPALVEIFTDSSVKAFPPPIFENVSDSLVKAVIVLLVSKRVLPILSVLVAPMLTPIV